MLVNRRFPRSKNPVLGMHDLETEGPGPHLTVATDIDAVAELRLLLSRKMKEAQGELPTAIADSDQQTATTAKYDFREQHLACDHRAGSGTQRAQSRQSGTVLVTQRQEKQQVLYAMNPELLQFGRERRADARESGQVVDRVCWSALRPRRIRGPVWPRLRCPRLWAVRQHRVQRGPDTVRGKTRSSLC